jgi:hypothetical protein
VILSDGLFAAQRYEPDAVIEFSTLTGGDRSAGACRYFNSTNVPRMLAIQLVGVLERMDVSALPPLVGMIVVIAAPNLVIPGVVSQWAIFGPVFIPILHPLGGRAADGARRLPLGPGSPRTS